MPFVFVWGPVFPAWAGMSPTSTSARAVKTSFPRLSGDEPASLLESKLELLFSLRERG